MAEPNSESLFVVAPTRQGAFGRAAGQVRGIPPVSRRFEAELR